jgi:uncharacterized protein (DUF1684 family)
MVPWRRSRLVAALLALSGAGGCDSRVPGSMVSIRPPRGWDVALEAHRSTKDRYFRESPETPLLAEDLARFDGLQYWEPDPRFYYVGPIHLHPTRERFDIITTSGQPRPCERFGWVEFPVDGELQRLEVYRLLDLGVEVTAESLLLPFTDSTTGRETYPAGRYVDLEGAVGEILTMRTPAGQLLAPGPYVLDFNRAYNPSCAYGAPERFACPLTPKENRMRVTIAAGERGYKPRPGARDAP